MLTGRRVDDRKPLSRPVERSRIGDRHEPEIALGEPLPEEAKRIPDPLGGDFWDTASDHLAETLPELVRESHDAIVVVLSVRTSRGCFVAQVCGNVTGGSRPMTSDGPRRS